MFELDEKGLSLRIARRMTASDLVGGNCGDGVADTESPTGDGEKAGLAWQYAGKETKR